MDSEPEIINEINSKDVPPIHTISSEEEEEKGEADKNELAEPVKNVESIKTASNNDEANTSIEEDDN